MGHAVTPAGQFLRISALGSSRTTCFNPAVCAILIARLPSPAPISSSEEAPGGTAETISRSTASR